MRFTDLCYLLCMRLKRISFPLRNAERFRRRGIQIGEKTHVYRGVHLDLSKGSQISIGRNCVLTRGCTILAHDACLTNHGHTTAFKPVKIGDRCFFGVHSIVLMGVTIGDDCIIGAGSIVIKDIPAGSVVAGNPAKIICTVQALSEKRKDMWTGTK